MRVVNEEQQDTSSVKEAYSSVVNAYVSLYDALNDLAESCSINKYLQGSIEMIKLDLEEISRDLDMFEMDFEDTFESSLSESFSTDIRDSVKSKFPYTSIKYSRDGGDDVCIISNLKDNDIDEVKLNLSKEFIEKYPNISVWTNGNNSVKVKNSIKNKLNGKRVSDATDEMEKQKINNGYTRLQDEH